MFFLTHLLNKPDTEHTGQVRLFRTIHSEKLNISFDFLGKLCLGNVSESQMGLLSYW